MPRPASPPERAWVRASEVGEYTFCARAWWLHHIRGLTPADDAPMRSGLTLHRQHGRRVQLTHLSQRLAWAFLALALLALLIALIQHL